MSIGLVGPADAAGWAGAVLLLLGYAGTATGRFTVRSRRYQVCNVLGSAGLAAVAAAHGAWPSVALNAAWLAVAALTWRSASTGPTTDSQLDPSLPGTSPSRTGVER